MKLTFWIAFGVIAYVYAGYPAVLALWALAIRRPEMDDAGIDRSQRGDPAMPGVTVIIAARDEAPRLPGRVENVLASDYPRDRLEIIVASDGSADGTVEALTPYATYVQVLVLPAGGKPRALNAAVSRARHPILVFTDARQRFAPDAIRRLVRHFENATIGAVSGELVLDCEAHEGTSTIGDGVGAYWKYEKWLRRREARVGSTIGVTGAIYAMRRALWQPLPPETLLDDVLTPMRVVLAGYRVVFDERARAFDEAAQDAPSELRRKIRTLAGNYQLLVHEPRLLLPIVNPVWLQFVSHKLGRLVVPYALLAVFGASVALAPTSVFFAVITAAEAAFCALAVHGARLDRADRVRRASRERRSGPSEVPSANVTSTLVASRGNVTGDEAA
jgi:cellulose synthase/poly-beta-1,6-N-acetylglucosamine synthase-like glycosyltransferase